MLSEEKVEKIHELYGQLTGNMVNLTFSRRDAWRLWAQQIGETMRRLEHPGLTLRIALQEIVSYRQRIYADKPHTLGAVLKFSRLVERPDLAEEDLCTAIRTRRRLRAQTPEHPDKARVLAATGRPAGPTEAPPKTPPEVLARLLSNLRAAAS